MRAVSAVSAHLIHYFLQFDFLTSLQSLNGEWSLSILRIIVLRNTLNDVHNHFSIFHFHSILLRWYYDAFQRCNWLPNARTSIVLCWEALHWWYHNLYANETSLTFTEKCHTTCIRMKSKTKYAIYPFTKSQFECIGEQSRCDEIHYIEILYARDRIHFDPDFSSLHVALIIFFFLLHFCCICDSILCSAIT